MARTATAQRAPRPLQINPNIPPKMVRYKPSGQVTNWSTLFRKELGNVEPFFRPGTDDRAEYILAVRRYEAGQALRSGDPFLGGPSSGSAFSEDYLPDASELDA